MNRARADEAGEEQGHLADVGPDIADGHALAQIVEIKNLFRPLHFDGRRGARANRSGRTAETFQDFFHHASRRQRAATRQAPWVAGAIIPVPKKSPSITVSSPASVTMSR